MFIGHYAPAFVAAAHVQDPGHARVLGGYFIAAQLVDFAFFGLVLTGHEDFRIVPGVTAMNPLDLYHMPYTHSLLGALGWASLFAVLTLLLFRQPKFALLGAVVVASHWVLDLLVHRPDLTLAGGGTKMGLGLWNVPWLAITLELMIVAGSLFYYLVRTRQRRGKSDHALYTLAAGLLLFQGINWFGPEPTGDPEAMALTGLIAFGVLVMLGAWLGSTREHWRLKPIAPDALR